MAGYAIYYSTTHDGDGKNYEFLSEVAATGASKYYLLIPGIGEGNPDNYFFYIQANATNDNTRSDSQVAKYTRNLSPGKHSLSIPISLNDRNVSHALQTMKFNAAWWYNNSDILDPWKSSNPLRPINDLSMVAHIMALWVVVTESCNFTIAGVVPKTTTIQLKAGWNYVGYPSFIDKTVAGALSGIVYERVEGYDNAPPQYLRIYADSDMMIHGSGFWIKVPFDQLWTLTNY